MIVAAFALDWFDNDCRDVVTFLFDDFADFRLGLFLFCSGIFVSISKRQGKINRRRFDPRPWKLREVIGLARVGIRQAHRVTAATVKRMSEMDEFSPALAASGSNVLADFPVHCSLQRILNRSRATLDEEI